MPACSKCPMLQGSECVAHSQTLKLLGRELPPPPVGACVLPLVDGYLKMIKPGFRVLEIGCGTWSPIKDHCAKVNAHYEGIDVKAEYYGKAVVATRIENLVDLSFPDNQFDFVIGNQTMEHWAEHGCSIRYGLYQCFRVCKLGGHVFMNVPIHFHGTKDFVLGRLDKIKAHFKDFSAQITTEEWGNPSTPLANFYAHPSYWRLKTKPAYILDVRVVKDRDVQSRPSKFFQLLPIRLYRFWNYAPSFLLYRLLKKIGIFPKGNEFKVYQP